MPAPALLVLLLAAGSAGELDRLLEAAEQARARSEWARSLALLEDAYALEASPELLNNMGRALEELGRYAEAAERYRRVLADPKASEVLKSLDRRRLAALEPKLEQAHLGAPPAPLVLWARGAPVRGAELPVAAGTALLEVHDPERQELVLLERALPAGRRTSLGAAELSLGAGAAWLSLRGSELWCRVERLDVDGYRLRAPLEAVELVGVTAGSHALRLELRGDPLVDRQVTLAPGQRLDLCTLARAPGAARLDALPVPLSAPARTEEATASVAPWILAGGAALAAGVGGGLWLSAVADREQVREAARGPDGVVTGLSFAEADRLEARANDKAVASGVLLAAGGAAVAGAIVWWLVE